MASYSDTPKPAGGNIKNILSEAQLLAMEKAGTVPPNEEFFTPEDTIPSRLIDLIYPVGSIYMTVNTTNPIVLFGGTWEKIKDRFLLSSGDTYTNGTTGGEATHTLTLEEIPSHHHRQVAEGINYTDPQVNYYENQTGNETGYSYRAKGHNAEYVTNAINKTNTGETGGSQPHNNMPPYLVVNVWKRIA